PKKTLKLEARFACRIGECTDPAVVEIAVAIEDYVFDVLRKADFGDERADLLGCVGLVRGLERSSQIVREGGGVSERAVRGIVDDLGIDVPRAPEYAEARHLGSAGDLLANTQLAPRASNKLQAHGISYLPPPLPPLPPALPAFSRTRSP